MKLTIHKIAQVDRVLLGLTSVSPEIRRGVCDSVGDTGIWSSARNEQSALSRSAVNKRRAKR